MPKTPPRTARSRSGPVAAVPRAAVAISARVRLLAPSLDWGRRRRREILIGTAALAVVLHLATTAALVEVPRLWPAASGPSAGGKQPDIPPTMEMVMDDNKYAGGSKPSPPASQTPPSPKAPPTQEQPVPKQAEVTSSTPSAPDGEVAPAEPDQAQTPRTSAQASPPGPPPEPDVNLDPADGLGYGHQDDATIIPAKPLDKTANKMPPYPRAAGRRGEQGQVQMLVSIGADGAVSGIEVAVSSGFPELDRTAVNAVAHWHFHPAMRDGRPVPTQSMQVFNFKIDR